MTITSTHRRVSDNHVYIDVYCVEGNVEYFISYHTQHKRIEVQRRVNGKISASAKAWGTLAYKVLWSWTSLEEAYKGLAGHGEAIRHHVEAEQFLLNATSVLTTNNVG